MLAKHIHNKDAEKQTRIQINVQKRKLQTPSRLTMTKSQLERNNYA